MTKDEIASAVRAYLERANLASTDVGYFVSVTEGVLNRELAEHPRNHVRLDYTVLDDTGLIPIPGDMAALKRVVSAEGDVLEQYPLDAPPDADTGHGYVPRGTYLEIFPTPAVDDVLHIDYVAYLTPLVDPSDTNWISTHHPDVYVYGCLAEAAVFYREDERLALWRQDFYSKLQSLKDQGWNQNAAQGVRSR
jgi:hypothetical protein